MVSSNKARRGSRFTACNVPLSNSMSRAPSTASPPGPRDMTNESLTYDGFPVLASTVTPWYTRSMPTLRPSDRGGLGEPIFMELFSVCLGSTPPPMSVAGTSGTKRLRPPPKAPRPKMVRSATRAVTLPNAPRSMSTSTSTAGFSPAPDAGDGGGDGDAPGPR